MVLRAVNVNWNANDDGWNANANSVLNPKRRAMSRIAADPKEQRAASYLGMLKHGNARGIKNAIFEIVGEDFWSDEP